MACEAEKKTPLLLEAGSQACSLGPQLTVIFAVPERKNSRAPLQFGSQAQSVLQPLWQVKTGVARPSTATVLGPAAGCWQFGQVGWMLVSTESSFAALVALIGPRLISWRWLDGYSLSADPVIRSVGGHRWSDPLARVPARSVQRGASFDHLPFLVRAFA